jgi:hypothetical protein
MTPLASVAILEKFALLKIAFCKSPVVNNASWREASFIPITLGAPFTGGAIFFSISSFDVRLR